jgi:hypothetical protein
MAKKKLPAIVKALRKPRSDSYGLTPSGTGWPGYRKNPAPARPRGFPTG